MTTYRRSTLLSQLGDYLDLRRRADELLIEVLKDHLELGRSSIFEETLDTFNLKYQDLPLPDFLDLRHGAAAWGLASPPPPGHRLPTRGVVLRRRKRRVAVEWNLHAIDLYPDQLLREYGVQPSFPLQGRETLSCVASRLLSVYVSAWAR